IDAQVTRELLVSLFIPEGVNKLHDGSVIIRNLRIAKAGVFFPMPEGRVMDDSFGSRHRAALGITEETDAVVVIVSEERGTISFCFNGNIATSLDGPKLHAMLEAIFSPKVRKTAPRKAKTTRDSIAAPPPSTRERELEAADEAIDDSPHVSLVADENPQSRRLRPDSDPPPPLRPAPASTPPPAGVSGGSLSELAKDLTKTPLPLGERENGRKGGDS
ncbi:MAG TPA: DNA integrity scanning protein DisA nucleotide-binding domain protein, partial [Polyangiaceae bacterium]